MIILRSLEPSDLALLYDVENDRELWHTASTRAPYSRYALKQFIQRAAHEDIYTLRQLRLVAEVRTDRNTVPVGFMDLIDFSPEHHRAEVGLIILPTMRRRGYAHAALCELAHYARTTLSLHQLYAYVCSDNTAAIRLFNAAGFQQTTLIPDWFYYAKTYKNAILFQKKLL